MNKLKIAITAETTIDLSKELLEKYDIHTVPFTVLLGDEVKKDGEITPQDIFDFVEKTDILPRTCAINEFTYHEFFEEILKQYDGIIHIGLSSKISSAFNNAKNSAATFKNVYVVDSKSLSTGIALLAIKACEIAEKASSIEEAYKETLKHVDKIQASFVVNTLEYLHKGGRCSGLARAAQVVLRIKPCIIMEDGKLIVYKKFVGRSRFVIADYCDYILEKFPNPDLTRAFVTYPNATPEMIEAATSALKKRGFKEIYCTTAGATITSHCGPKTLGILYLNK